MLYRGRSYYPVLLLGCALSVYSCSNSTPAGESGNPDVATDSSSTESSADQVGSVPEDMLADEQGADASAATATPSDSADPSALATSEATSADPFSDLADAKAEESGDSGSSAPSGSTTTYTVKAGDTLMKIAFHLYGDLDRWKEIKEWNKDKIKLASRLSKGMVLTVEEAATPFSPEQHAQSYEIKKGDTLANIADEVYGRKAKYKKLQNYNKSLIKNPNRIFAGFTIFYDITAQEIAEAEARRAQRMAQGEGSSIPSAISPPGEAATTVKPVAISPSAADTSAEPGPGGNMVGPPSPTAH